MTNPLNSGNEQRNGRCFPLGLAPATISGRNAKIESAVAQQFKWNGNCLA